VTITGCLEEATPGATGTSGAASNAPGAAGTAGSTDTKSSASAGEAKYKLTNAAPAADGTTASAGSSAAGAKTYRLVANDAALMPHVGKKLELTGTLEEDSANAGPASDTAQSTSTVNMPKLRVESGKVVAASCSQ
jgi:hypothetical protein